jgi:hypothetical protein
MTTNLEDKGQNFCLAVNKNEPHRFETIGGAPMVDALPSASVDPIFGLLNFR